MWEYGNPCHSPYYSQEVALLLPEGKKKEEKAKAKAFYKRDRIFKN